jgi:hypothetical protein
MPTAHGRAVFWTLSKVETSTFLRQTTDGTGRPSLNYRLSDSQGLAESDSTPQARFKARRLWQTAAFS